MKNYELIEFVESKEELKKLVGNIGFTKAIVKNLRLAETELEILESLHALSEDYRKILIDKENLLSKYSKKDEDGTPVFTIKKVGGKEYKSYELVDEEAYKVDFNKLMEDNKEVINLHLEKELNYEKAMNEDFSETFMTINEEDLPNNISVELLMIIDKFVNYK